MDWIKLTTYGILRGSIITQLTLEERATWVSLLCYAGEQRDRGIIRRAKGIPYTREEIAIAIHVPLDVLNSTISKCMEDENADDPRTRIVFGEDKSLVISNWEKYQSKPEKTLNKEAGIAKAVDTRRRQGVAVDALIASVNRLNIGLRVQRYEVVDGRVLDKTTGNIVSLDQAEGGIDK